MNHRSSSQEFSVLVASLPDYESVVAEIYYGEDFVGLISQDDGPLKVELPGIDVDGSRIERVIPLKGFQEALIAASRRLQE